MILTLAVASALSMLFLIMKFGNLRRVLYFDKWLDLGVTIGLAIAFFGTASGMAVAVLGGGIFSAALWAFRKAIGCEKLTFKGWVESETGFLNKAKEKHQNVSI